VPYGTSWEKIRKDRYRPMAISPRESPTIYIDDKDLGDDGDESCEIAKITKGPMTKDDDEVEMEKNIRENIAGA
jgi:hypothetical protein